MLILESRVSSSEPKELNFKKGEKRKKSMRERNRDKKVIRNKKRNRENFRLLFQLN